MSEPQQTKDRAGRLAGLDASGLMQLGLDARDSSVVETEIGETGPEHFHFVPPKPEQLAGHFPELEIMERIGRGGMGCVYKTRQKRLDRLVALKILPAELGADPSFAERFAREARALARLVHPNIVTIHDFGSVSIPDAANIPDASSIRDASGGEMYYLVMEYMDGMNLRELLDADAERLDPAETLDVVRQLAGALQYAHDMGIVHRDVKPENILFDRRGHVKICDFGLVKLAAGARTPADHSLTLTRHIMGTPHYMAPEQWESARTVDHRADIYGLGVVFYEMLTGRPPLGRFPAPSKLVPVDPRVDEVVLKALEREPEERYQSAGGMEADIKRATGRAGGTLAASSAMAPSKDQWRLAGRTMPEWMNEARPWVESAQKRVVSWWGALAEWFRRLPWATIAAFVLVLTFSAGTDWIVGKRLSTYTQHNIIRDADGRQTREPVTRTREYWRGYAGVETVSRWGPVYMGNYMPCIAAGMILLLALIRRPLGVRADMLTILLAAYGVVHIGVFYAAGPPESVYSSYDSEALHDVRLTAAPAVVGVIFAVLLLGALWNIAARIYRAMEQSEGVKSKMRSFYRVMFGNG